MDYIKSKIAYVDFSKTSIDFVKKIVEHHGINNITWIKDSILNIPSLKLGKFDYFNCSGVLHHLGKPDLGIKILYDALKENASGSIMVYG